MKMKEPVKKTSLGSLQQWPHGATDVAVLVTGRPPAPRNWDSIREDSIVHGLGALVFDSELCRLQIRKGNQMKRPTFWG